MSTPTASPSSSAGGLLTAAELFENELETATRQNYARAANSFHEWWADNSQNYDPSDIFTRDAGTNTYIMSKPAAWVALCEKKKGNPLIDYAAAVIPGYRAKDEQGMAHVRAVRAALHGVLKDADGSYTARAIQRIKAGFRGARKANDKWMMENGLDDNAKDSVPLPVYEALAKWFLKNDMITEAIATKLAQLSGIQEITNSLAGLRSEVSEMRQEVGTMAAGGGVHFQVDQSNASTSAYNKIFAYNTTGKAQQRVSSNFTLSGGGSSTFNYFLKTFLIGDAARRTSPLRLVGIKNTPMGSSENAKAKQAARKQLNRGKVVANVFCSFAEMTCPAKWSALCSNPNPTTVNDVFTSVFPSFIKLIEPKANGNQKKRKKQWAKMGANSLHRYVSKSTLLGALESSGNLVITRTRKKRKTSHILIAKYTWKTKMPPIGITGPSVVPIALGAPAASVSEVLPMEKRGNTLWRIIVQSRYPPRRRPPPPPPPRPCHPRAPPPGRTPRGAFV